MNATEKRALVVKKYESILGRNKYSQSLRAYCFKKYKDGKYYSDCSSSVALSYKEAGFPLPGGSCPNTVGLYQNKSLKKVAVEIKKGIIQNPSVLRPGDMLLFAGTDASRAYADCVGHVEMVAKISGSKVTIYGHGSGTPRATEMNAYCKSRYSKKASTKIGNRGLLKVVRYFWDDETDSTPTPTPSSGGRFTDAILKRGAEGSEVVLLQESLIALGFDVGSDGADGDFGPNTEAAVKQFQTKHGLLVDGEAGPDTKAAIERELEKLTPSASTPATPAGSIEITGGSVHVRTGPGTKFASAGIVYKGTKLAKLQTSGWTPIMHNGALRWMATKYLKEKATGIVEVTGATVNVRKGPGSDYGIVGVAKKGEAFSLPATEGWIAVSFDSCARWVSSKYAKAEG